MAAGAVVVFKQAITILSAYKLQKCRQTLGRKNRKISQENNAPTNAVTELRRFTSLHLTPLGGHGKQILAWPLSAVTPLSGSRLEAEIQPCVVRSVGFCVVVSRFCFSPNVRIVP